MKRFRLIGTMLALGATLAFAGSASAFGIGGGGGHAGGGGGGMHVGGGGMHMGGGAIASGRSVGFANNAARPNVLGLGAGNAAPNPGNVNRGGHNGGRGRGGYGGGVGYGAGYGGYYGGYYGDDVGYGYGYDDPDPTQQYGYGYGDPGVQYAPVRTGRSAAEPGNVCETPVKSCTLHNASLVGQPCSCKGPHGRSRGHVAP